MVKLSARSRAQNSGTIGEARYRSGKRSLCWAASILLTLSAIGMVSCGSTTGPETVQGTVVSVQVEFPLNQALGGTVTQLEITGLVVHIASGNVDVDVDAYTAQHPGSLTVTQGATVTIHRSGPKADWEYVSTP